MNPIHMSTRLQQITHGAYGHFLNHRQVFSPDGNRVYFDTRNADPDIISTDRIESIDWRHGELRIEAEVEHPTPYGPGIGAVICHPQLQLLLCIHGLRNCDASRPYSTTRRFGGWVDASPEARLGLRPGTIRTAESRSVDVPCFRGSLRGGTHAHSWSRDGRWISFTYNDHLVERDHRRGLGPPDLRTVGVMRWDEDLRTASAQQPAFESLDAENFVGCCWAVVATRVVEHPAWGSDEIDRACEECWVESTNMRRLAFLGRVRDTRGRAIDELFLTEFIEPTQPVFDQRDSAELDDQGRLLPPEGWRTRRLSHTEDRPFPGVSGPRNWLLSSPDGKWLYCPMRDARGIVQIARVAVDSGAIEWVSDWEHSLTNQITIHPSGRQLGCCVGSEPGVLDVERGSWQPLLRVPFPIASPFSPHDATAKASPIHLGSLGSVHFLPNDLGWIFHGIAGNSSDPWLQLWTVTLH